MDMKTNTAVSKTSSMGNYSGVANRGGNNTNWLQSAAYKTDKISDKLFSKNSLRWITAANIREKEQLIHLFRTIDKAIRNTNLEIDYRKKAINRQRAQLRLKKRQKSQLEQLEEEKKKRMAAESKGRRARAMSAVEIESALQAATATATIEDEAEFLELIGKDGKFFKVFPESTADGFEVVREPENDIYIPPITVDEYVPSKKPSKVRFASDVVPGQSDAESPVTDRDTQSKTPEDKSPLSPNISKSPVSIMSPRTDTSNMLITPKLSSYSGSVAISPTVMDAVTPSRSPALSDSAEDKSSSSPTRGGSTTPTEPSNTTQPSFAAVPPPGKYGIGRMRRGVIDVNYLRRMLSKLQKRETASAEEEVETFTEEERKVYEFIHKTSLLSQEYQQLAASTKSQYAYSNEKQEKERLIRTCTERSIRRLSAAVGDMSLLHEEEEAKRQRHLARIRKLDSTYFMPKSLPPLYQTKNKPLEFRDLEWEAPTPRPPPLTNLTWDELKCCRYVRDQRDGSKNKKTIHRK